LVLYRFFSKKSTLEVTKCKQKKVYECVIVNKNKLIKVYLIDYEQRKNHQYIALLKNKIYSLRELFYEAYINIINQKLPLPYLNQHSQF